MTRLRSAIFALSAVAAAGRHADLPLLASHFVAFDGRDDNYTVTCDVSIATGAVEGTQVVFFTISGADTVCDDSNDASGTCSISVHEGTSCNSPPGDALFSQVLAQNPWIDVRYGPNANGLNVPVHTGLELEDLSGKVVIVTDSAGEPLACSPLAPPSQVDTPLLRAELSVYPEYSGAFSVTGDVTLVDFSIADATYNILRYNLAGVDPRCEEPGASGNSCGVHVHAGTSCEVASGVGGHYFEQDGREDPWKPITYFSNGVASSGFTVPVDTGLDRTDLDGRAIVVHDLTGARIACGLLAPYVFSSAWLNGPTWTVTLITLAWILL